MAGGREAGWAEREGAAAAAAAALQAVEDGGGVSFRRGEKNLCSNIRMCKKCQRRADKGEEKPASSDACFS